MSDHRSERQAVVIWLIEEAMLSVPAGLSSERTVWMRILWALCHPLQFREAYGRIMTCHKAAVAISRGDHVKDIEPI